MCLQAHRSQLPAQVILNCLYVVAGTSLDSLHLRRRDTVETFGDTTDQCLLRAIECRHLWQRLACSQANQPLDLDAYAGAD